MIKFKQITDSYWVWLLMDVSCDVTRLFDDPKKTDRTGMKNRIREIVENPDNKVYEILYDNCVAGFFLLYAIGDGVFETHIVLRPLFRGLKGIKIGKEGTQFALGLEGVKELVSFCPKSIPESFAYALKVGWKSLGKLDMIWRKNNVDYLVMGVFANKESVGA